MTIAHTGDPVAAGIAAILEAQGASAVLHDDPGHLVATGAADVAIGDALGYARHLGIADIGLIPNVALLLDGFSGYLRLLFRPGSENLQRIAMEDPLSTAGVVAGLLLIEKHEIEPTIVQAASEDSIDKILEETDGLLVVGAQAVETTAAGRHGLDLADEWLDVTEGPLPYLLAWGAVDRVDDP